MILSRISAAKLRMCMALYVNGNEWGSNITTHNHKKKSGYLQKTPCQIHAAKPLGLRGIQTFMSVTLQCSPLHHHPPPTPTHSNSTDININTSIWMHHSQLLTAVPASSLRWDIPPSHRKCCKVKLQRALCHDFLRLARQTQKLISCNRTRLGQQTLNLLWRGCCRRYVVLQMCSK